MNLIQELFSLIEAEQLVENPAADAKFEKFKAAITEKEEELIQLLEAMIEKVKAGDFEEVIKDSRDFASLAHKAKDLADKMPDMPK
jgi:DNA replication initiation complex subunit (GINS family)